MILNPLPENFSVPLKLRLLALAVLLALCAVPVAATDLNWDSYWNDRTLSLDAELGIAILTDSSYEPTDYLPGYGFTIQYYLPKLIGFGFEFQQNQKTGDLTLPSKNYGDLDAKGRVTLTATMFQIIFSSPVIDDRYNIYLEAGIGSYIVNLDADTSLPVHYQGQDIDIDYTLSYTLVEMGYNGGVGIDIVYFDALKIGLAARIHFINEQEEETDFGAMNVFFKIGYTL